VQDNARGDARAAIDDELVGVEQIAGKRRIVEEEAVACAGDPARDRVDRLDLAAPALGRAGVDERQALVAEPAEQLVRVRGVVPARARDELGSLDPLRPRAQWAAPGLEPEHRCVVVPEVA
jgi:hypothetical protein